VSGAERPTKPPDPSLTPGAVLRTPRRVVSMEDIEAFAHLTGDENPLHLDEAFAKRQLFEGRVAHGLLTLADTLGLWYRAGYFDGWAVVFTGIEKLRFLRPVRPGETLTSQLTVVSREVSPRGDRVELENVTLNDREEPVLSFTARLLLAPLHEL
jgi:acyl dehydratase